MLSASTASGGGALEGIIEPPMGRLDSLKENAAICGEGGEVTLTGMRTKGHSNRNRNSREDRRESAGSRGVLDTASEHGSEAELMICDDAWGSGDISLG